MRTLLLFCFLLLAACSEPSDLGKQSYGFDENRNTCSGLNSAGGVCGDFRGLSLDGTDYSNADLRGSNFAGASLKNVNFQGAKLSGSLFLNTLCEGCIFDGSVASSLKAQNSSFENSSFKEADLQKSQWINVAVKSSNFETAVLDLSFWKDNVIEDNSFVNASFFRSFFENNRAYGNLFSGNNFSRSTLKDNIFLNHQGQVLALRANPSYDIDQIKGNSFFGVDFKDSLFLNNFFALNEFIGCAFQRSRIYENLFYGVAMNFSALNNAEFFDNSVSSLFKKEGEEMLCLQDRCSDWSQVQALSLFSQRNIFDSTVLDHSNFTGSFFIDELFLGNLMEASVFDRSTFLNVSFSSSNLKEASFVSASSFLNTIATDQNIVFFQNSLLELANFQDFNPSAEGNNLKGQLYFVGTDAKNANFQGADLNRCYLVNTDFSVGFDGNTNFNWCQFNDTTILPFDLDTALLKGMFAL